MTTSAERIRGYEGPAILSFGFRPLFLAASIWSAFAMALWMAMFSGAITLPSDFDMVSWHVHEFLYGYLPAVAAGFLLTAVPNWTGRLPVTGTPLLILVLSWLAGRIAIMFSELIGLIAAAVIDLSFLVLLSLVIAREVIAGSNWRNLKVLVLVGLLTCGNVLFHLEAEWYGTASAGYGTRLGIAVAIFLIILIGGRIIPSFTRNWLARREPGRMPISFDRFDLLSTVLGGVALAFWVALPDNVLTGDLCLFAGAFHLYRLARWAGDRTMAEPLVLILHIGYLFVPLGFFAVGIAQLEPAIIFAGAAVHAWTAGAIGIMTLAVMTRASLGHAGRPLNATRGIVFIYICVIAAAILRVAYDLGAAPEFLLHIAAAAWIAAFAGFAIVFAPLLIRPRK
jgi:uncharacterized protein involved in response to NO